MKKEIYLIEKIWVDNMENHIHTAVGYNILGYIKGEEKAINFCNNGKNYTSKDCWVIPKNKEWPQLRYKKLENLLGEKVVVENHSRVDFRENFDSDSGLESYCGFFGGMFKDLK